MKRRTSKQIELDHRGLKRSNEIRHRHLDDDIRRKKRAETYQPNDFKIFSLGRQWFNDGMKLEEAPQNLSSNINFVNGYKNAERVSRAEVDSYNMGYTYASDNIPIEELPLQYRNSPFFMQGYNDAKNNVKRK